MAYLKLNEQNQIVNATAEDAQVELMEGQWTVAWVENNEIKMWGCSDESGFIDSTQFYHNDVVIGASNELDEAQTTNAINTCINQLKNRGRKVYKDAVEQ